MATFEYQAYGRDGRGVRGSIEADSKAQAFSQAKERGVNSCRSKGNKEDREKI